MARPKSVDNPRRERWQILCDEASQEMDGTKLLQMVTEINRLLAEKRAKKQVLNDA